MVPDISEKVLSFIPPPNDKNSRYLSWEHCYKYFSEPVIEVDKACLHLSFYLASWGMYRGSSFLLQKDYLIHKEVVEKLISVRDQFQNIDFSIVDDAKLHEIIELCHWIKDWYTKNTGLVDGKTRNTVPTPTLVTKILLGTLGCIPAYDGLFDRGLHDCEISPRTMTFKGLRELVKFYKDHQDEFDALGKQIRVGIHPYPTMKLVDMYFWQVGFKKVYIY